MGKELSLARSEETRQSVLLASSGDRACGEESSSRDQRTQKPRTTKGYKGGKAKGIKTKGKVGSKAKRINVSTAKSKGRGRDNKNRQQNRRNEGEDSRLRRNAQQLGIAYPSSQCSIDTAHYWKVEENISGGALFRCVNCGKHIWLPLFHIDGEELGRQLDAYGLNEGYCRFLNRPTLRAAKIMLAKLQELERLSENVTDKVKFAKSVAEILGRKDYDRKEA